MLIDFTALCALAIAASPQPAIAETARSSEISVASDGRMVFVNGPEADLFLADPDGRNLRRLTRSGGTDTPSWSPDGRSIAFVLQGEDNADIYILDVADGSIRPAITGPAYDIHPAWSPLGSTLMFTRYTDGMDELEALTLHVANIDGSEERALATASYGSFSPDGAKIAYWRYFDGNADIAVASADGTSEHRLTLDPAFDGWPAWSPDGRLIAFARRDDEGTHIRLLDIESGENCAVTNPVTQGQSSDTSPRWRPDGTGLFFDRSGGGQLSIQSLRFGETYSSRVQSPDTDN